MFINCKGQPNCFKSYSNLKDKQFLHNTFLAALSSSWSLVVGRSIGLPLWKSDQKVIKIYLCTYLQDSSCSSDISDSSDNIDSSDSNDSSENSDQTTLYTKKFYLPKTYLPTWVSEWVSELVSECNSNFVTQIL